MKLQLGERLRMAREHARITQAQLEERSGIKQATISKIERGESENSTFTVRLAVACGVRPEWLDMEEGPMLGIKGYTTSDPKLIAMCRIMEDKAEYVKDAAVKEVTQILELVDKARANGGNNGTDG